MLIPLIFSYENRKREKVSEYQDFHRNEKQHDQFIIIKTKGDLKTIRNGLARSREEHA